MDTLYKIKCSGNATLSGIRNMKGKKPYDMVLNYHLSTHGENSLQPWSKSTWVNNYCNGGGAMVQAENYVPV